MFVSKNKCITADNKHFCKALLSDPRLEQLDAHFFACRVSLWIYRNTYPKTHQLLENRLLKYLMFVKNVCQLILFKRILSLQTEIGELYSDGFCEHLFRLNL